MNDDLVMYCVFAQPAIDTMGGNRGKLAAMAGHAFLHSWWELNDWEPGYGYSEDYRRSMLAKKIVLVCDDYNTLYQLEFKYKGQCSIVRDAGLTVFKEPKTVCIGIGPILKSECSDTLRSLKVLI